MPKRVAIMGGGVAGLSAAHELINRGFDVSVYEANSVTGGKARSLGVTGSGLGGRLDLPGEHGFRFFPGFYQHLPATMKEIQVGLVSAFDHLVAAVDTLLARTGGKQSIVSPNHFPTSLGDLIDAFEAATLLYCDLGIPKSEVAHFIRCLIILLVSCDDRRFDNYENQSWSKFLGASTKSAEFNRYLVKGLSRSLVALNADALSSRTGGGILLRFLVDFVNSVPIDRVLDMPTNDAWLTPWFNQLDAKGVDFHLSSPVESISCAGNQISKIRVRLGGAAPTDVTADYYIAAWPVEVMQTKLTTAMRAIDPSLSTILSLQTAWMTGIMFYLNRDVPIVRGHSNYLDSPWALTSISQPQFWSTVDLANFGDGTVRGLLSVIISNWEAPLFGTGPSASNCTEQQVIDTVWGQLKDHLNSTGVTTLADADLVRTFVAPCLHCSTSTPPAWTNKEPLFINTVGSWPSRPQAVTGINNFFLAADYVQTNTDLATMESANEAARRAVNGILDREGSSAARCQIFAFDGPAILEGYRAMDEFLFAIGMPPAVPPLPPLPWPCP